MRQRLSTGYGTRDLFLNYDSMELAGICCIGSPITYITENKELLLDLACQILKGSTSEFLRAQC